MQKISILIMTTALLWLSYENLLFSQSLVRSVVSSMGASVEAGSIQLDYSVGEAVIVQLERPSVLLTQGFHQGERVITGLRGLPPQVSYRIYPNPFSKELQITMDGPFLDFWVLLYDVNGRPLEEVKRQVKANGHWQERFDLTQQASGMYFLLITGPQGKWLKSHTIIKQ